MEQVKNKIGAFKEYYRFPLMIDEYCGNVIAQPDKSGYMKAFDWIGNEFICEYPIEGQRGDKLAEAIVKYLNDESDYRPDFIWSKDPAGDPTIICMNGVHCIEIRGWGNLTSDICCGLEPKYAAKIQDEFRDWIIDKLNGLS